MAKDNVNVADELKDEKQKANLTQSAKEAEAARRLRERTRTKKKLRQSKQTNPSYRKFT